MENYIEIKRFPIEEAVEQISEIFDSNEIEFLVENTKPTVDITFTNSGMVEYIVKVKESDFDRASALLESNFSETNTLEEHYMDSFSDDELIDVVTNPKDWDNFDLNYAKELIKKREITIDEAKISTSKIRFDAELKEPEKAKSIVVFMGYLFAILGGWIGAVIGYSLRYKEKEVEGDEVIYYYDAKSRRHGDFIMLIFFLWVLMYVAFIVYIMMD